MSAWKKHVKRRKTHYISSLRASTYLHIASHWYIHFPYYCYKREFFIQFFIIHPLFFHLPSKEKRDKMNLKTVLVFLGKFIYNLLQNTSWCVLTLSYIHSFVDIFYFGVISASTFLYLFLIPKHYFHCSDVLTSSRDAAPLSCFQYRSRRCILCLAQNRCLCNRANYSSS